MPDHATSQPSTHSVLCIARYIASYRMIPGSSLSWICAYCLESRAFTVMAVMANLRSMTIAELRRRTNRPMHTHMLGRKMAWLKHRAELSQLSQVIAEVCSSSPSASSASATDGRKGSRILGIRRSRSCCDLRNCCCPDFLIYSFGSLYHRSSCCMPHSRFLQGFSTICRHCWNSFLHGSRLLVQVRSGLNRSLLIHCRFMSSFSRSAVVFSDHAPWTSSRRTVRLALTETDVGAGAPRACGY